MRKPNHRGAGDGATRVFHRTRRPASVLSGLLLLALVSALAAGCGGPADVTGQWSGTMDFEEAAGDTSADLELSLEQADDGTVNGTGTLTVRTPGDAEETELSEVVGRVNEDGGVRLAASGGGVSASSAMELAGETGGDTIEGDARMASRTLAGDLEGLFSGEEPEELTGTFELERQE